MNLTKLNFSYKINHEYKLIIQKSTVFKISFIFNYTRHSSSSYFFYPIRIFSSYFGRFNDGVVITNICVLIASSPMITPCFINISSLNYFINLFIVLSKRRGCNSRYSSLNPWFSTATADVNQRNDDGFFITSSFSKKINYFRNSLRAKNYASSRVKFCADFCSGIE